ncbi:glucosamine-6-phosphate deaminase [Acholeplasma vituli]|uniref:Glucosamine-6-phosphate deaminase n=1 Tax=Paracholeplasma vituli TaxID=69473 RepID=A0ABT2PTI5_9MOLU|nr:glucosamine-6-phosphate deaminase [Paracholeplasma vituli]MCU0104261.1 glucosamine-6-phosphate deaminase [Paracholeplasma vituli]
MNIHILRSKAEIDRAVADLFIEQVKANPNSVLGLATGSTPLGVYALLAKDHKENHTDYHNVTTVNLDEYIGLPDGHPESYKEFMKRNLFNHINVDFNRVHIPSIQGTYEESCKAYNDLLNQFVPDIQLLGIGANGHIGFNEPGTKADSKTHTVLLAEKTRLDNARFFNHIDEVPTHAITMGIQNILDAKRIVLIATGASKADAIYKMITGEITESLPASFLQKHSNVDIFLDKEAAKLLLKK